MTHPLRSELADIVGPRYVADSDFAVWAYARDSSGFPARIPGIVVRPGTTDEVCAILKLANRERVSVVPRGGGTAYGRSPTDPERTICLDLTRLRRLIDLNETNRTVTVEAGMTCSELETRLRGRGLYAHTVYGPADSVTVGGVISGVCGGGGGQMFSSAGENGAYVVGVKAVLPGGDIVETGSRSNRHARMFARAGHGPDLTGLFIGHMGLFGVTTEVTLRVFPWPPFEEVGGVSYDYGQLDEAYRAFGALARHEPRAFSLLGLMGPGPESIARRSGWWVVWRVNGFSREETEEKLATATRIIADTAPPREWDSPVIGKLARKILRYPHDVMGHRQGMWNLLEPLAPRDDTLRIVRGILKMMDGELEGWQGRLHSDGTAIWMHGDQNYLSFPIYHQEWDIEAREKAISVWKKAAELALQMGAGFCVLDKDIGDICAAHFPPQYLAFLRTIKVAVDPNNIMNPHLLGLMEEGTSA